MEQPPAENQAPPIAGSMPSIVIENNIPAPTKRIKWAQVLLTLKPGDSFQVEKKNAKNLRTAVSRAPKHPGMSGWSFVVRLQPPEHIRVWRLA